MSRFPSTFETEAERRKRQRDEELALLALLGFLYDPQTLRYRTAKGYVPQREVRRAVESVVKVARADVRDLARQVMRGEIAVAEWQDAMARLLKTVHVCLGAVARGGFNGIGPVESASIESILQFQFTKLEGFAGDIVNGHTILVRVDGETGEVQSVRVRVTEKKAEARAEMYAASGDGTYENGRREAAQDAGMLFERNVLGNGEHCEQCIIETARKWVPLGTLTAVGERTCLTNCLCTLMFVRELPA